MTLESLTPLARQLLASPSAGAARPWLMELDDDGEPVPRKMHQLLRQNLPKGLQLRPTAPDDDAFLEHLYASTRDDLQALGPAAEPLIRMQYQAKIQGYQQSYPHASNFVIEKHRQAIGQIMLNVGQEEVRVIELAFLPEQRNRGLGKAVLGIIQQYAAQMNNAIVLSVNQNNHAAKGLYSALGFRTCATEPPNERMLWQPAPNSLSTKHVTNFGK